MRLATRKQIFCIPGGKREAGESDLQVLLREITEELTVTLLPATLRPAAPTKHLSTVVPQNARSCG